MLEVIVKDYNKKLNQLMIDEKEEIKKAHSAKTLKQSQIHLKKAQKINEKYKELEGQLSYAYRALDMMKRFKD